MFMQGVSWAGYEAVPSGAQEFSLSMFNELWSKPSGTQFYMVTADLVSVWNIVGSQWDTGFGEVGNIAQLRRVVAFHMQALGSVLRTAQTVHQHIPAIPALQRWR